MAEIARRLATEGIDARWSKSMSMKVTARSVAVGMLVALIAVPGVAAPRDRFVARGEITGPGLALVTFEEWNLITCPEIPTTQGLTSYFIELPRRFADPSMLAEATGERLAGGFPLQLTFWASDCTPISAGMDSPTLVPKGTSFIEVFQNVDAAYTFKLTVSPLEY